MSGVCECAWYHNTFLVHLSLGNKVVLYCINLECLYDVGVLFIQIACTVVAALLHYLWLVVFFLRLCEGLDIFISIVIVFPIKSVLVWFLLLAYGT